MLQSVKMRNVLFSTIVVAASVLLPVGAGSQQTPDLGPCQEDFARFCHGVRPGGGRVADCMKKHRSELTPDCRTYFGQVASQAIAIHFTDACRADLAAYCKDVKPGGGRLLKCLDAHHDQLSESCQEAGKQLAKIGKRSKTALKELDRFVQSCQSDVKKFCPEVQPGGGAIYACLKPHQDELSQSCKTYLSQNRGPHPG